MPDKTLTVKEQEAAAERYWQSRVERGGAARAADTQTIKGAETNAARDNARVRQDRSEDRRTRRGYSRR
jgi:hypothetical protein